MPRRLVIHAGFHKTGTTSIQETLKLNRPVLRPVLHSVFRPGLKHVVVAARGFSTYGDVVSRAKFRRRFRAFLKERPLLPEQVLCLSAEELSGHLPGRPKVLSYRAAIKLAKDMAAGARSVFPDAELVLFYTTRNPDDWLASAYAEHVKSSSMTMAFEEFVARYRSAAELDDMVKRIASTVSADVIQSRLEETANDAFGPAAKLLDICDVPQDIRDQMTRPEPANRRPDPDVLAALLEANRTVADKTALKAAKNAIIASAYEVTG